LQIFLNTLDTLKRTNDRRQSLKNNSERSSEDVDDGKGCERSLNSEPIAVMKRKVEEGKYRC